MELSLFVRFYTNGREKQNMWIDQEGKNGIRYEVNIIEDIKISFQDYIDKFLAETDQYVTK